MSEFVPLSPTRVRNHQRQMAAQGAGGILVLRGKLARISSDGSRHRTFSVLGGGGRLCRITGQRMCMKKQGRPRRRWRRKIKIQGYLHMDWVAGVDGRQWLLQGEGAAVRSAYSTGRCSGRWGSRGEQAAAAVRGSAAVAARATRGTPAAPRSRAGLAAAPVRGD